MKRVVVMSRREAEAVPEFGSIPVISIRGPEDTPAKLNVTLHCLQCCFPDTSEISNYEMSRILNFLKRHHDADTLVVHCEAGKSRSAGVAVFCAEAFNAEVDIRGKWPNLDVVRKLRDLYDFGKANYEDVWA